MAKYLITRKRIVYEQASFELEVDVGQNALEAGNGVDAGALTWETTQSSDLSTEVSPVEEVIVPDEPELFPDDAG
ncbi:hypothetical protein N5C81_03745 [Rhizobium pusense]|uniref:hypothetical protein n=1 Tax=Agrobacterium pusense TaxID=648995 RepID=UPI002446B118|nr:hypothetical protein [Agrobacterium pusense]MDH1266728.1 hypothetical protein [Agrobacterium pusense]